MIETYNNIIFWIGYITVASAMIFFAISLFWVSFEKLMNTKKFFIFIFNSAYNHRIKTISKDEFYKWHKEAEEKFLKTHKDRIDS